MVCHGFPINNLFIFVKDIQLVWFHNCVIAENRGLFGIMTEPGSGFLSAQNFSSATINNFFGVRGDRLALGHFRLLGTKAEASHSCLYV